MKINLAHSTTGLQKRVKLGFSWTTFFFGFFPALLRGDLKWTLIMFLLMLVTFGLSGFYFIFAYNKIYIKGLMEKGFRPADDKSEQALQRKGLLAYS